MLVDHGLVVVKPEHFKSVAAEEAAVIVSANGEVCDFSSSQSTDECFVLVFELPLDQYRFLSS